VGSVVERAVVLVTVAVRCAEEAAASASKAWSAKAIEMFSNLIDDKIPPRANTYNTYKKPNDLWKKKSITYTNHEVNTNGFLDMYLGRHLGWSPRVSG
jgi:hypothetical protein